MILKIFFRKFLLNDFALKLISLFYVNKWNKKKQNSNSYNSIKVKDWAYWNKKIKNVREQIHPRFILSSEIARKAFSPVSQKKNLPYKFQDIKANRDIYFLVAATASEIFSFLDFGKAISWVSQWGAILDLATSKMKNEAYEPKEIIEFGSGAGINPIIQHISNPDTKIKLYDLEEMVELQKTIHNYWNDVGFVIDKEKFEYYYDVNDLYENIDSEQNIDFYAFWSFSESPIELRNLFNKILIKCKRIVFVSNQSIFGIDNLEYFQDLKQYLGETHNYNSYKLPLTNTNESNESKYLKNHLIHCFDMKS